ncbi:hypothetical protein VZ95_06220 [Elstera litoralis]|uniref:Uncharacterized protein n=1 Tax=Elstera litoralis TaxID=552518 RepID=A0A0F3IUF1_9PROT|nr:DUF1800 domain-containing protein [Elstera litoralis]KJV10252.1 hypothetical protein VZ95_06220 [Elstera litoralis]
MASLFSRRPRRITWIGLLLAPLLSFPALALDPAETRHLMDRVGFGATPADFSRLAPLSRTQAVELLLAETRRTPVTPLPDFLGQDRANFSRIGQMAADERKAWEEKISAQGKAMKAWWMQEMLATPSPLTERMVLFWHNHFVSSFNKVRDPEALVRQNLTFRRLGLVDFRGLLTATARDPAMMLYLDTTQNRRQGPNENFARELFELFTLGEGHYSEDDIKQAARAFAGWTVDQPTGRFKLNPGAIDPDVKMIFAKSGPFDGQDVLDLVLDDPQTAKFILNKLWLEFVSDTPDAATLAPIERQFAGDWRIDRALAALLESDAFWSPENRGRLTKSPVDLVVGTLHRLNLQNLPPDQAAEQVRRLGQDLFEPPTVRGWPGGTAWINTDTLLQRREVIDRLVRGQSLSADGLRAVAPQAPLSVTLLALPPRQNPPAAPVAPLPANSIAPDLDALLRDPAYQVK